MDNQLTATLPVSTTNDSVTESSYEKEHAPKVFAGAPVYVESIYGCDQDGNFKQGSTRTHWAACLFKDADDTSGCVTAEVIGMLGVASEGATFDDALANIKEALELALEDGQGADRCLQAALGT